MKKGTVLGVIVIAIAIGVIISTYTNSSTYGTFADAIETQTELHVVGYWSKNKPLLYDAAKGVTHFSFYMRDSQGQERKVVFEGTKPQDFEHSEQLVLVGKMTGPSFYASKILMKCPSKYNKDNVELTNVKTS